MVSVPCGEERGHHNRFRLPAKVRFNQCADLVQNALPGGLFKNANEREALIECLGLAGVQNPVVAENVMLHLAKTTLFELADMVLDIERIVKSSGVGWRQRNFVYVENL